MLFPLAVGLLIGGYGIAYWGAQNFRNGGKGPGFAQVFGLSGDLVAEEQGIYGGIGKIEKTEPNLIGQPPTTVDNPPGGVWT